MASFMASATEVLKDNPFGGLAEAFASTLVDKLVDVTVTPDGFAMLMEKGKLGDTKGLSRNHAVAMSVCTPRGSHRCSKVTGEVMNRPRMKGSMRGCSEPRHERPSMSWRPSQWMTWG